MSSTSSPAFLVASSYSAGLWARTGQTPLLPGRTTALGQVARPGGEALVEYVLVVSSGGPWPIPGGGLPQGVNTIGAADPQLVRDVVGDLENLGFTVEEIGSPTLSTASATPAVTRAVLLLALAVGCVAIWWSALLSTTQRELATKARCGATPLALTLELSRRGLASLAPGVLAGAGLILGVAAIQGGIPLWPMVVGTLASALAVVVGCTLLMSVAAAVRVWSGFERLVA